MADLERKDFSPMDYKMWVLQGHYQGTRNFTFESLAAAKQRRLNWRNRIALCYQQDINSDESVYEKILEAVSNNLNSAEAFAVIDNSDIGFEDWEKIDKLFGLKLIEDTPNMDENIYTLIHEREDARAEKDFASSDGIRDELLAQGIALRDTPDGAVWEYKN